MIAQLRRNDRSAIICFVQVQELASTQEWWTCHRVDMKLYYETDRQTNIMATEKWGYESPCFPHRINVIW